MQIYVLGSGSDGNSTLVVCGETVILFDAGLGPLQLKKRLTPLGIDRQDINACFLTHDHGDHIGGLMRKSYPLIPIYASPDTYANTLWQYPEVARYPWQEQKIYTTVHIGECSLTSFSTSHDAKGSVAYILTYQDKKLLFCTDLGEPSLELIAYIKEATHIILESNHDSQMLRDGPYPYYLKKRVAGSTGHLSNAQTAEILFDNLTEMTELLILAHLSRTNNVPSLALSTIYSKLNQREGLNSALRIDVAPALASGNILRIN